MSRLLRAARVAFALSTVAVLAACHAPPTEIVLRVETDMPQGPGAVLQAVHVRVVSQDGMVRLDQLFTLGAHGVALLPNDLGITPSDARRTVEVDVTAVGATGDLFTYRAIAPFEVGHTNELLVFLADRCRLDANRVCMPDETCGRNGCEAVMRTSLPDFSADASTDVTGSDAPGDATLDATMDVNLDAPLDALNDLGSDIGADNVVGPDGPPCGVGNQFCNGMCTSVTDRHNCLGCGIDCTLRTNTIAGGDTCDATRGCLLTCLAGYGDCDSMSGNGCEADLTADTNCGACGIACPSGQHCTANASGSTYACAASCGGTTPSMCGTSCVDLSSDVDNCGGCGVICPRPGSNGMAVCTAHTCSIACSAGYHLCGAQCVANNSTSSCGGSCGGCAVPANASPTCDGTSCGFVCNTGWGNCDGIAGNGCETALDTAAHCGSCSNTCTGSLFCQASATGYSCVSTCTPGSCTPSVPCHNGNIDCSAGGTCVPTTTFPVGTVCNGSTGVCNSAGSCVTCSPGTSCSTGNPCTYGTVDCSTGAVRCAAAGNVTAGTMCGPGAVCDGGGHCNGCNAGTSCSTGNPCTVGVISCASGAPQCVTVGSQPSGTMCGGSGTCDGSGGCTTCTPGMPCDPGNECLVGMSTCPTGCAVTGTQPPGASCSGGVCNGDGYCAPCSAGVACMPTACTTGYIMCSTGMSVCSPSGNAPSGTSCPGGVCDGAGRCATCTPGMPCGHFGECWNPNPGYIMCPESGLPLCSPQTPNIGMPCDTGLGHCDSFGMCVHGTGGPDA